MESVSAKLDSSLTVQQTHVPAAMHPVLLVQTAIAARLARLAKSKTQKACASALQVHTWTKQRKHAKLAGQHALHARLQISVTPALPILL